MELRETLEKLGILVKLGRAQADDSEGKTTQVPVRTPSIPASAVFLASSLSVSAPYAMRTMTTHEHELITSVIGEALTDLVEAYGLIGRMPEDESWVYAFKDILGMFPGCLYYPLTHNLPPQPCPTHPYSSPIP